MLEFKQRVIDTFLNEAISFFLKNRQNFISISIYMMTITCNFYRINFIVSYHWQEKCSSIRSKLEIRKSPTIIVIRYSNISLDKKRPQQTTTSRAAVFHGLSHMTKSHLRNCSFSSVTEYAVHKIQIRVLLFSSHTILNILQITSELGWDYRVQRHFQQYFSYIVEVGLIGEVYSIYNTTW
jgi:hypothetical protein